MHGIRVVFLQASPGLQPEFVMKAGLLIILLCGVIIYLTILHRHKKNRLYTEKILQEERFNRELLSSKVEVQEATFTSVGVELHDNVGQLLSTAFMLINMTERNMAEVPDTLSAASATLNKSIIELRSLSKSLNKDWLEQFELYRNLQTEISRLNSGGGLQVTLNEMDENIPLTPEQQFILFRMLQEGMQNVVRHANASLLEISITGTASTVLAALKDNGQGFNTRSKTTGVGIPNMRQRAASLGGSVKWESGKAGTSIIILLPLKNLSYGL